MQIVHTVPVAGYVVVLLAGCVVFSVEQQAGAEVPAVGELVIDGNTNAAAGFVAGQGVNRGEIGCKGQPELKVPFYPEAFVFAGLYQGCARFGGVSAKGRVADGGVLFQGPGAVY